MGKSLLAHFFINFLLVAMVLNLSGEVNGIVGPVDCGGGGTRELYITATCEVCKQLCGGIQGIGCSDCHVNEEGVSYCTCVFA
ncbi:hypothetical protein MKX03_037922 [Papaver bracteatum]|nr:hypothetical protein MKX03_037922 [Papaver bracteatum]